MSLADKRKRSGFVRVGSASHAALLQIASGLLIDAAEPAVIKNLAAKGYIKRTYSLTQEGQQALAQAIEVKRKHRSKAEFGLDGVANVLESKSWFSS